MVAVIINTSSAFYVYFIMPHPYPEATHSGIYRLARYGYKKRMSNDDRSQTITHSPLSSAVWTGLEPATPCVTGRYSNQLNYHTKVLRCIVQRPDFVALWRRGYCRFASAKL